MYSQQQHYPIVDNTVYPPQPQQHQQHQQQYQRLQPQQHNRLQSPLHPTVLQQQQQQLQQLQRVEPLPSATDAKPNITLSISEIAEFSSTMVYLMWHAKRQSVMDLHSCSKIDAITHTNNTLEQTRVTADMANNTSAAFKKFCRQILTATQLSESVVLLSLKYIAMLLQNNPNIQGADGSEYRLFTVALMLANKFLDDNTFTNKTWSEVSGMKVIDLNIMELEFLDVLRFKLSIRKEEYERWRTALFNFRSELINVPAEIQRQKLMETMALSVGSNQQQQQQWLPQQQTQQPQQQVTMQQQQQQRVAAVAASHNFYLFSKAQQQYPVQPTFNGPLARVPLRIPARPVYHNIQNSTPSAPPNVLNANIYDTTSSQSNVIPQQQQHRYSATSGNSRRPSETVGGYAPYQKQQLSQQQQQARIPTSTTVNMSSSRPTTPSSNIYSQQQQQVSQPSPYSTPIANGQPYTRTYPQQTNTNTTPNSNATSTSNRASHRTSSLPQQGGLDLNVKSASSSYYYATPSPTNNSNIYQTNHHVTTYPSTTSYYVDPTTTGSGSNNVLATPSSTTSAMSTSPADYNPYVSASNNMNDAYNRPMIPRSTSYKNVQPQQQQMPPQQHQQRQLPVTPNGHYTPIPLQHDIYSQQPLPPPQKKSYNGPTLEDPITAIDSYKTRH